MMTKAVISDAELLDAYGEIKFYTGAEFLYRLRVVAARAISAYAIGHLTATAPKLVKLLPMRGGDFYIAVWSDGTIMKSSDMKNWIEYPTKIPRPKVTHG